MNINRDNYEAYFLDFIEGRLSPEQEEVLHRFLKFNPDLEAELASFDLHTIRAPHLPFPNKQSLKKEHPGGRHTIDDANFDMFCIAYLEGDLTEEQRKIFESYLAEHPGRKRELDVFKAAFLEPVQVNYPLKSKLKQRRIRGFDWRIMVPVAAAATIAILVLLRVPATQTPIEVASVVEPEQVAPEQVAPEQAAPEQVAPEQAEQQPVEEKEAQGNAVKPMQATFNMVKKTHAPVPVSDFTEEERMHLQQENSRQEYRGKAEVSPRIARLDLRKQQAEPVPVKYDQLRAEVIQPPTINNSSLSILALARYQAQRASKILDEEDALLWNLASSGIKELNRITGSETELMASRNDEGAISGIRFKSRFLDVTAPIARDN